MHLNIPTNCDDVIDSRDVEDSLDVLRDEIHDSIEEAGLDPDDFPLDDARDYRQGIPIELARLIKEGAIDEETWDTFMTLLELQAEGEGAPEWPYGEALIRDSYFQTYAMDLAEDLGLINTMNRGVSTWPFNHIDWRAAAEELKVDYMDLDFDGITYWIRA